jgi:hypothetical protein
LSTFNGLPGIISQKTELFITAVRTSNLTLDANVDINRALKDNTTYCCFLPERFSARLSAVNHQIQAPNLNHDIYIKHHQKNLEAW